jgi:hypothetical protein
MTIDQYLMPDIKSTIPVAEIWTLRKYFRGGINQVIELSGTAK